MKRKHILFATLAAAIALAGCGEPSATQQTCDKIGDLYESADSQWLPQITTGIKDRNVAQHAERVADGWQDIWQASEDDDLAGLMSQLQPVLDEYSNYADQPMGDHPKDDAALQQLWTDTSAAIGQLCSG